MFSASGMSSDPPSESHRLTLIALATLEDVLSQAHVGPVSRSWGVRLALSWLQHAGVAEPWQARQLWQQLASERDRPDYEHAAQYIETVQLTATLDNWRAKAGVSHGPDDWARHHRVRLLAPDLDPRPGTPHLSCMCNRYQPGERKRIIDFFDVRLLREFNEGPPIVHSREPGWVVRQHDGEVVLEQMTWGFPVYVRGRVGQRGQQLKPKPVNNARFDKLGSFWKRWAAMPKYRCLIPATRYAEAVGNPGSMTTTWLSLKSAPIFAWAGLWTDSDEWGPVYTAVMTTNCAELAHIHDRSPVIVAPGDWSAWLSAPLSDLARFDRPWPAGDMAVQETQVLWKNGGEPENAILV